jgi:tryptophan synthase alpha subunit
LFSPYVDGIVVGSAIVKMIAENSSREDLVSVVSQYAREMKQVISVSLPL